MKPIIGCTTYRKTADQNPPLEVIGLMPSYLEAIAAAGGIPLMIPLGLSEADLVIILNRIDGLLLPGGGDIDPRRYGGNPTVPTLYDINPVRDETEIFLTRQAVQSEKPLLAICRGVRFLMSRWEARYGKILPPSCQTQCGMIIIGSFPATTPLMTFT
ncbi:MAG: gamma-glutamyl-gamma-aminobutyrate hydrolase family protein [Chloroflexi bacterium]|nr:gamma-glutamyl-gamma-aminobutyrate hydrolase family protein [Chloroflexota bacterium]